MFTQHQSDRKEAETILELWSRGYIKTKHAKQAIRERQYDIDFGQPDYGSEMVALYRPTGEYEYLIV